MIKAGQATADPQTSTDPQTTDNPPVAAGGYRAGEVRREPSSTTPSGS
jgi:hypothetical protein